MAIGQITRSVATSDHKMAVTCGLIWRDEFDLAGSGVAEVMETDALAGSWCGSAISINFATIYAVTVQVDPLTSTVSNDMKLSVNGGADGTFPLVTQWVLPLGDGIFSMGSVDGWTCGTDLEIVLTNDGDATRTCRVAIAGDE